MAVVKEWLCCILVIAFLAVFGQPTWVHVHSGEMGAFNMVSSWIILVISIVGFVLLINLLAMMAESYSRTENQSAKEVLLKQGWSAFWCCHNSACYFRSCMFVFLLYTQKRTISLRQRPS